MLHLDVKMVGQIPEDGGWRLHGRGSARAQAAHIYTYLHSAFDGHSRPAFTKALENETAATTFSFLSRARALL